MDAKRVIRILLATLLVTAGVILVLLDLAELLGASQTASEFLDKMGIALTVAGVVSLFHEILVRSMETEDTTNSVVKILDEQWEREIPAHAQHLAQQVCEEVRKSSNWASGIRLVSDVRKGWDGYYYWAIENSPSEIFFAGRSVLHRVDQDMRQRGQGSAEQAIARRLRDGARIRIMFLNPRSDLVSRLASEEGQTKEQFLTDIATTIGIVKRLNDLIVTNPPDRRASLDIRVYDEVPYFAFHRVEEQLVIGFYFQTTVGHASAAYEVLDQRTKEFFAGHFDRLFHRAESAILLAKQPRLNLPILNQELLEELTNNIANEINNRDRVYKLLQQSPWSTDVQANPAGDGRVNLNA